MTVLFHDISSGEYLGRIKVTENPRVPHLGEHVRIHGQKWQVESIVWDLVPDVILNTALRKVE